MKKYNFTATIEQGDRGGAYVLFPYEVEEEFGTKGRVPVKATFNGVSYAGSLIKYGSSRHMIGVLKSIRSQIGAEIGDAIRVEIWKDEMPRTLEVPPQLKHAMDSGAVLTFFECLSYSHRKEYCRWISDAKTEATRLKRIAKTIEMLQDKSKNP